MTDPRRRVRTRLRSAMAATDRCRRAAPHQPPRRRDQPVPAPARPQPGRLVPVGPRGADARASSSTGRSSCRSATRRATGATSWSASRSRTRRRPAYLNERFISIKVDREERPDLDQIYMGAVQAMTGGGGWPMSVFLTPDGRPFYGGTYFPTEPRHGLPSFRQVLEGIDRAWREQRDGPRAGGGAARRPARGVSRGRAAGGARPTPALLDTAVGADRARRSTRRTAAGAARRSSRSR